MRQATYTSGPWRVTGDIFGDNPAIESEEYVIAELPTVGDGSAPHTEANARLIASAPELLQALEGMLEWARRVKGINPGMEVCNAITAVDHATGRQAGK